MTLVKHSFYCSAKIKNKVFPHLEPCLFKRWNFLMMCLVLVLIKLVKLVEKQNIHSVFVEKQNIHSSWNWHKFLPVHYYHQKGEMCIRDRCMLVYYNGYILCTIKTKGSKLYCHELLLCFIFLHKLNIYY